MQLFWSMARDPDIFQSSVASSRDASLFPIFLQYSSLRYSSVLFRKHLVYNCIAAPLENRSTFLVSVRNRKWFTWATLYANSVAFLVTSASVLQKFFRQCLHWIWSSPRDLAHLRKSASVELGCNQRTFLLSRANTNLLKRESDTRIEKATTTFGRLRLRVWSTGNLCPR